MRHFLNDSLNHLRKITTCLYLLQAKTLRAPQKIKHKEIQNQNVDTCIENACLIFNTIKIPIDNITFYYILPAARPHPSCLISQSLDWHDASPMRKALWERIQIGAKHWTKWKCRPGNLSRVLTGEERCPLRLCEARQSRWDGNRKSVSFFPSNALFLRRAGATPTWSFHGRWAI